MGQLRTGSLESLRERNRLRVVDALRQRGAISRSDIARQTGLSRSTVSSLVADLQAAGLVVEREVATTPRGPEGGRPPVLIALDQSAGALVGVVAAHAMFELPLWQAGVKIRSGPGQWLAEGIATFGLLLTILATLRARPTAVPMSVGLYILAAYWFTASTSFANPAVTMARAFSDTFAGIRLHDVPAFIAAQLVGAVAGLLVARWLFASGDRGVATLGETQPVEQQ